ncbi:hypothetical protein LY13_004775 [Prauserella aidingensis]|uniref:hypothetical protein n=1 Tax=Prauserella aidingensis TaxID=387890 RepID=UPI0020A2DB57|nr:hypothetical protein [Prauserella aidingensis]MCP2255992.1 hypothetical protein [Prauserella aidingensis]
MENRADTADAVRVEERGGVLLATIDRPVGLEVLDASTLLTPDLLAQATSPDER